MKQYLKRRAEKWVSTVVLLGCVMITGVLVYTAFQAQALGDRLVKNSVTADSN